MEQDHKINLHRPLSQFPRNIEIVWEGHINQSRTVYSLEEMKTLLEEVKLFNSENKDNQKRIISK